MSQQARELLPDGESGEGGRWRRVRGDCLQRIWQRVVQEYGHRAQ